MIAPVCRNRLLLACAAWCLFGLVGCGGGSPEKVYQTWSSAVKAGNFPAIWECLTPQTRGTVLQIMVLDADLLSAANPGAKQAFGTVFAKYGLNPQDASFPQTRLQVTNAADYALDLNNVLRQYQGELSKLDGSRYEKLNAIWMASSQAGLAPSQKQGTRATAAVQGAIPHTTPNAQVQAVFEKVNGQWLFAELEETSSSPEMAGGPAGGVPRAGMPGAMGPGAMKAIPGNTGPGGRVPGGMPAEPGDLPPNSGGGEDGARPAGGLKAMPANPEGVAAPGGPEGREGGLLGPGMKAMPANSGGPDALKIGEGAKAMPANPGAPPTTPGGLPGGPMAGKAGETGKAMPANRPGAEGETPPSRLMIGKGGEAGLKNMPANADAAGANPAEPGGIGRPGGGANLAEPGGAGRAGTAGGGGQNRPKLGTWEYAIVTFVEMVAEGNYSGIEDVVSSKAKGLLKEIRDDEVSPEKREELQSSFAEASPVENSARNKGAFLSIDFKGKQGHTIQLSVGKEDGEFKIRDLKIHEPGATKKR